MQRSQQGAQNHPPMAVVPAEIGIHHQGLLGIVLILPGQVECQGQGLLDVAGRAEHVAGDIRIRTARQFGKGIATQPLQGCGSDRLQGLADIGAEQDVVKNVGKAGQGGAHQRPGMGQGQMGFGQVQGRVPPVLVEQQQGQGQTETADVFLVGQASGWAFFVRGPGLEKLPVAFLHIGVVVGAGRCHERHVPVQIVLLIVFLPCNQAVHQQSAEFQVQGVFSGFQKLVIVDAALPPESGLAVQDVRLRTNRAIPRAPENAVRVGILRSDIVLHPAIVPGQGSGVVIPVHRHGQGIGYAGPKKRPGQAGRQGYGGCVHGCGLD